MKQKDTPRRINSKKLFFLLSILVFAVIALIPLSPRMLSSGQVPRSQDGGIESSDQQASSQSRLLTRSGKLALAVLAFVLMLWITETFPFH